MATDSVCKTLQVCVKYIKSNRMCKRNTCQSVSNNALKHPHPQIPWTDRTNLPLISISFEHYCFDALLDTGSQIPLLCDSIYDKIPNPKFSTDQIDAFGCDGGKLEILGTVLGELRFHRFDAPIQAQFYILKNSSQQAIIPHSWLKQLKAVLNYNLSSLSYEIPSKKCLLTADGNLQQIENGDGAADDDGDDAGNIDNGNIDDAHDAHNGQDGSVNPQVNEVEWMVPPHGSRTFVLPKATQCPTLVKIKKIKV